jgi:hypothetical protein
MVCVCVGFLYIPNSSFALSRCIVRSNKGTNSNTRAYQEQDTQQST